MDYCLKDITQFVVIKNTGNVPADLSGWKLISEKGADQGQTYTFSKGFILDVGKTIKLIAGKNPVAKDNEIVMAKKNIWNNSDPDPAVLVDNHGVEIDRLY